MAYHRHICGCYYIVASQQPYQLPVRKYLPQVDLSVHTTIVASTSRTTLTQNFVNPLSDKAIPELRYTFPLYDGVSVVGFTCTINKDRVIRGVVKERNEARQTYDEAVARGETAGLLEQLPDASDVFSTTISNIPSGAEISVDITYLGELKHDAEVDGIRFTIPTSIAPRYGHYPGELVKGTNVSTIKGIKIIVDAETPQGSNIKSVQSPSHPISVTIGNTSTGAASGAGMSLQKASATLSLGTTELDKDFVLQVVASDTGNPIAVLETHPSLPNHRAIMTTLVPKFNLPSSRPEIVFVCDRSGSMDSGQRIPNLKAALQIFLKSLPLGVKFNICSFGSHHKLLFDQGAVSYDASSVEKATKYVDGFAANYGGTEMYRPLEDVIGKRHKDMDLEVFLLTDGEVWNQENLINLINKSVDESKGSIRVFTLGIGDDVSHALIEGLARAGNGFSQTVMDNEKMNSKVLRMLKAALTPHIKDYSLEIKYEADSKDGGEDMDFEVIEKVMDSLMVSTREPTSEDKATPEAPRSTISLFDPSANPDAEMKDASKDTTAGGRYAGVPPVSEPKLLQAPFIIPPLYPFNRTSVYLLLSPESAQKTPKSVVLRGTSAYGPLELEVPITILPDRAETIHQLAARKAIRELEDGRGWIFHAKDANGTGSLLRDQYPGRFSDMVEREAVRLGVKFQVGGKWCSFVAVDTQGVPGGLGAMDQTVDAPSVSVCSVPLSQSMGKRRLATDKRDADTKDAYRPKAKRMGGTVPSHAAPPSPMAKGVFAHPPLPRMKTAAQFASFGGGKKSRRSKGSAWEEEDSGDDGSGALGFVLSHTMGAPVAGRAQPNDALEIIVKLQAFDGYWKWTDDLLSALEIDGARVYSQAQTSSSGAIAALRADLSSPSDKLATAIVLAFLETKMKDRKDEWEMLAEKAYHWLEVAISGTAENFVTTVGELLADAGYVMA
ncbi:hypothetical protein CONLIGDRAFT_613917 [Coniochaeta ligniaria NRRL 30616]|uniref:VIT-domain-containing protein n=1 Tax=Coniochaeta ligniaria NRRL 30616 TaxID=1408157 RepID=A0A1J7ISS5_9PEZI|nr:hypothetical protein CONLIGDRAFT_613917 [Coniochaeta ligniaria NRRL 30616]